MSMFPNSSPEPENTDSSELTDPYIDAEECCEYCDSDEEGTILDFGLTQNIAKPVDKQPSKVSCQKLRGLVNDSFDRWWQSQTDKDWQKWWEAFIKTVCAIESPKHECKDCEGAKNSKSSSIGCYQMLLSTMKNIWDILCNKKTQDGGLSSEGLLKRFGITPEQKPAFCAMLRQIYYGAKGNCASASPCGKISKQDQEFFIKLYWLLKAVDGDFQRQPDESIEDWLKRLYTKYYKTNDVGDWGRFWPLFRLIVFPPPPPLNPPPQNFGGCVGCRPKPKGDDNPWIAAGPCFGDTRNPTGSGSSSLPILTVTKEQLYDMKFTWAVCNAGDGGQGEGGTAYADCYNLMMGPAPGETGDQAYAHNRPYVKYGENNCGYSLCGDEEHFGGGYNFVLYINNIFVTKFNFNNSHGGSVSGHVRIRDLPNYISMVNNILINGILPGCQCISECEPKQGREFTLTLEIRPDSDFDPYGHNPQRICGGILLNLAGQEYFTCLAKEWNRCGGTKGGAYVFNYEKLRITPFKNFCSCWSQTRNFPSDTDGVAI